MIGIFLINLYEIFHSIRDGILIAVHRRNPPKK